RAPPLSHPRARDRARLADDAERRPLALVHARRSARLPAPHGVRALGGNRPRALRPLPLVRRRQAPQPGRMGELPVSARPRVGGVAVLYACAGAAATLLSACAGGRRPAAAQPSSQPAISAPSAAFLADAGSAADRIAAASERAPRAAWDRLAALA